MGIEEWIRKHLAHKEPTPGLNALISQPDHSLPNDPGWPEGSAPAGSALYLMRLRAVGVTEAVGEEESDSCGEVAPMAMSAAGDAPSGADTSRFISSLLRLDTAG